MASELTTKLKTLYEQAVDKLTEYRITYAGLMNPTVNFPDGTSTSWNEYEQHLQDMVDKSLKALQNQLELDSQLNPFEVKSEYNV